MSKYEHQLEVHYFKEKDYHNNSNPIQEIVIPMDDTNPVDPEFHELRTENNILKSALESQAPGAIPHGDLLRGQLWTPFETNCLINICNKYINDKQYANSNYTNNEIYNCIRKEMMLKANITRTTDQVVKRIDSLIKNGRIERKGFLLNLNEADKQNISSITTNQEQFEEIDYDRNLKEYIDYASSDQANINDDNSKLQESKPRQEGTRWSLTESQYMLKLYKKYIGEVRVHGGLFRNKKGMWERIALDINKTFDLQRTGMNCENRFKTMKTRRKKRDLAGSHFKDDRAPKRKRAISSSSSVIESDGNDITTPLKDKDAHEELATNNLHINSGRQPQKSNTNNRHVSGSILLRDTLLEILQTQEENRERQHREIVNLLGQFLTR